MDTKQNTPAKGQKGIIKKEEQVQEVKAKTHFNLHNRFDLEVIDSKTGEIKQKAYAENIMLNQWWTRQFAPNTCFNYIHFGTGTGDLDPARTSLFTFLGAKSAGSLATTNNFDNGWVSYRKQIQLLETEYVGSELKEVGIGYDATSNHLVTHALLRDMNGNPITITKTNVDIINIYATVFVHWDTAGYGNKFIYEINFTSNTLFRILAGLVAIPTSYWIWYWRGTALIFSIDPANGYPTSIISGIYYRDTIIVTFNAAQKKIISGTKRLAAASGNLLGGIKSISISRDNWGCAEPYIAFNLDASWYEKTSITGESIGTGNGVNTNFNTAFGYIKSGAKVYIDGVETAGVTLNTGLPRYTNQMGETFQFISCTNWITWYDSGQLSFATNSVEMRYSPVNIIYYNPYWEYGISSLSTTIENNKTYIYVSDDMINWTQLLNTGSVPAELRNKKYWRIYSNGDAYQIFCKDLIADTMPQYNIVFATPPGLITGESVGTGDGVTTEFTLAHTPISGSLTVKLDGEATTEYTLDGATITFNTVPAEGVLITADYKYSCTITADYETETIAKDENHVFDFSFEITLGEKTD